MSNKQLRRYLEENEGQRKEIKKSADEVQEPTSESDDEDEKTVTVMSNRYAFLGESGEAGDEGSGEVEEATDEKKVEKKVVKKKRKGKKKIPRTDTDNDLELLDVSRQEVAPSKQVNVVFEKDLFKVDSRMLNVENELRSILGRKSTDAGQRGRIVYGKIVKKKPHWPEVRNVGLSMELDRTEGDILWFKFSHNAYYRELQQTFWTASDSLDHNFISNILAHCPYHLDSLLVMAEVFRQQEDYQLSRDLIERGIFCCETAFAPRFQLGNFNHRIDYIEYENRAFFLLLHRHLRNLIDRHCFKTALHVAKLIYRLNPVSDPLAIMLTIDSVALKAQNYDFLILLYNTLKASKNLDRLPNFAYSIALARFLIFRGNGKVEDKELADSLIASAIRHFPTVLLKLLDAMNVQPDPVVENNKYMNALAHEREREGIKLLTSIYVKLTSSVWLEDPAILSWLEAATTATVASFDDFKDELDEWEKLRKKYYVGIPRNIERHAYLWEVTQNSQWVLTDPAPPYDGRQSYARASFEPLPDTFFSGLIHSVWPNYDQGQTLNASIEEVLHALRQMFITTNTDYGSGQEGPNQGDVDEEADDEVEGEGIEEREPRPNDGVDDDDGKDNDGDGDVAEADLARTR